MLLRQGVWSELSNAEAAERIERRRSRDPVVLRFRTSAPPNTSNFDEARSSGRLTADPVRRSGVTCFRDELDDRRIRWVIYGSGCGLQEIVDLRRGPERDQRPLQMRDRT